MLTMIKTNNGITPFTNDVSTWLDIDNVQAINIPDESEESPTQIMLFGGQTLYTTQTEGENLLKKLQEKV